MKEIYKTLTVIMLVLGVLVCSACGQNTYKCPKSGYKEDWKVETTDLMVNEENSINMKIFGNSAQQNARTLPICYNDVYDAIYYINYSDHKYIYRYKDGESKLAVEIPADYIYSLDGDIYFMVDVTNDYEMKGMQNGDVFKYSPTTGKLEFIVSTEAVWMKPSEKGIYYYRYVEMEKYTTTDAFFYDFSTNESIQIGDFTSEFFEWGEEFVAPFISKVRENVWMITGIGICNLDEWEKIVPSPEPERVPEGIEPIISNLSTEVGMYDSTVYAYGGGSGKFVSVNLETEERTEFSREYLTLDFTVIENKVYFASDSTLTIVDIDTGEEKKIEKGEKEVFFSRLFNINNELYALCYEEFLHHEGEGIAEIVRVEIQGNTYQIKSIGE